MANRIPLVVDSVNLNIKELPDGDRLDLGNSAILNVGTTTSIVDDLGILNGNCTVNVNAYNYFTATANADITFTFNGAATGDVAESFILRLSDGGSHTITWPTNVYWPSNTAPTLSTSNSDLFVFITDNNGNIWRAASLASFIPT